MASLFGGHGGHGAQSEDVKQRVQAALARRQAGGAKARIGDDLPVNLEEEEEKDVHISVVDKLAAHTYVFQPGDSKAASQTRFVTARSLSARSHEQREILPSTAVSFEATAELRH